MNFYEWNIFYGIYSKRVEVGIGPTSVKSDCTKFWRIGGHGGAIKRIGGPRIISSNGTKIFNTKHQKSL